MTEPIQVELVGSAWQAWPAILAVLISLGTLVWTVWDRSRSKARLEVVATSFVTMHPLSGAQWYIAIEATNTGVSGSTVVTGVHFGTPVGSTLHLAESALPTVTLPKTLAPGESMTYVCDIEELAAKCREMGIAPKALVPTVASGHGRFKGKWAKVGLNLIERELAGKRPKPS